MDSDNKTINYNMVEILTWVAIISGGILIILMLLSLLGGLDLDLDLDIGGADTDAGTGGGLGVIKALFTFLSVSSWVMKVLIVSQKHTALALTIGILVGIGAVWLLNYIFRLMLKNEENVNWEIQDALFQNGTVYLKIKKDGEGLVHVDMKGAVRELKARSKSGDEIKTGQAIRVVDIEGESIIVEKTNS